jgi:hypothetical protein
MIDHHDHAVMAYKGTKTDILYGVAMDHTVIRWHIKGLKLTYYVAWRAAI